MLNIALWKRVVILGVCLIGLLYALPNLLYARVEAQTDPVKAIEAEGASDVLLAERDAWPVWLPSGLVNLGLDLRGGAHLLAEVQVDDVYAARIDTLWTDVRDALRDAAEWFYAQGLAERPARAVAAARA